MVRGTCTLHVCADNMVRSSCRPPDLLCMQQGNQRWPCRSSRCLLSRPTQSRVLGQRILQGQCYPVYIIMPAGLRMPYTMQCNTLALARLLLPASVLKVLKGTGDIATACCNCANLYIHMYLCQSCGPCMASGKYHSPCPLQGDCWHEGSH